MTIPTFTVVNSHTDFVSVQQTNIEGGWLYGKDQGGGGVSGADAHQPVHIVLIIK